MLAPSAASRIAELGTQLLGVPIAVVSEGRSIVGIGADEEVLRTLASAASGISVDAPISLRDLCEDAHFRDHSLVTDAPFLRSLVHIPGPRASLTLASSAPRSVAPEMLEHLRSLLALLPGETRGGADIYRTVFLESLLGVVIIGLDGHIVECNGAAAEIIGRPSSELCGRPFLEAVRGDNHGMEWEPFEDLIAGEWDHYQVDKSYARPGRQRSHARLTISLVRDPEGAPVRAVCMIEDTTQTKRAEMALREAKERAEVANRAKSQFLATMSHEFRTPLNSVIGFTNVLLTERFGELSEKQRLYLQRVHDNGTHLLELINDTLDLSKIEADRVTVNWEEIDLATLIQETLAQLEGRVIDRPVDLAARIPDGLHPLRSDGGKLRQILINLVGNALKFTEAGHVHVIVHAHDGRATRIDVEDTGIGIPHDRLGAIFQAFEQADGSTTRKYGGTGLGLAISSKLAALLGLRIEVSSTVGEGSTFSILLDPSAS